MAKLSTAEVLRLRAPSAVSRDQSVRRSAQDDDSVGSLTENILNKWALMGLTFWALPCRPYGSRLGEGLFLRTHLKPSPFANWTSLFGSWESVFALYQVPCHCLQAIGALTIGGQLCERLFDQPLRILYALVHPVHRGPSRLLAGYIFAGGLS